MSLVVHHRKFTHYVAFTTITENVYYDSHYNVWIEISQEFRIVGSCFVFLSRALTFPSCTIFQFIGVARGGAQGARAFPNQNTTNDKKL